MTDCPPYNLFRTGAQAAAAQAELRSRDLGSSRADAELGEARQALSAAAARAEEVQAQAHAAEAEAERLREALEAEAAELAALRQHLDLAKAAQREAGDAARNAAAGADAARADAVAAREEAASASTQAQKLSEQLHAAHAAAAAAAASAGAAEHGTAAVLAQRVQEYAAALAALEQRLADEQQRFAAAEDAWSQRLQMATPSKAAPGIGAGISNKKDKYAAGEARVSMMDVEAAALSGPVSEDGSGAGRAFSTLAGRIRGLAATAPKPLGCVACVCAGLASARPSSLWQATSNRLSMLPPAPTRRTVFTHGGVLAAASQLDRVSLALGKAPLIRLALILYVALLQLLIVII